MSLVHLSLLHCTQSTVHTLKYAYMTISFSYVYFRGLQRGIPSSSLLVMMAVQRRRRAISPLSIFIITVSAMSSALCPTKFVDVQRAPSGRGLVVRIHNLHQASCGLESPKSMVPRGRASNPNSLLSSNKFSLSTREQTPQSNMKNNNAEYKRQRSISRSRCTDSV